MKSVNRQMQSIADDIDQIEQEPITVYTANLDIGRISAIRQDRQINSHQQVSLLSRTRDCRLAVAFMHHDLVILILESCNLIAWQRVTLRTQFVWKLFGISSVF